MSKKTKKWKNYEIDMWNDSWIVAENNASNAIVDFYNKKLKRVLWLYLYESLKESVEDDLSEIFYSIGRASLSKKDAHDQVG